MRQLKTTHVETTTEIQLSDTDLIEMLKSSGVNVPWNADVFVKVPDGGDWLSGTKLHVSDGCTIKILFTERMTHP